MDIQQLAALLSQASQLDPAVARIACELFDAGAVELLPEAPDAAYDYGYHLRSEEGRPANRDLYHVRCALLDSGLLPLSNGVVMGPEHEDLRCSFHPCPYKACPVAMAAGFLRYQRLARSEGDLEGAATIPVYSLHREERRHMQQEIDAFRERWEPRLKDSELALNLLLDPRENDFSGLLVLEDDSWRDAFIADVLRILAIMGKVDEGACQKIHLMKLTQSADPINATFGLSGTEDLVPRTLYVIDRLLDPLDPGYALLGGKLSYVIERLSHIVDERYVLVVGTSAEISSLLDQDSRLTLAFDQHRLNLRAMTERQLYGLFLENLTPALKRRALAHPTFEREFSAFVAFNRDCIPFTGEELADYLAKNANAHGRLALPTSRYQSSSLEGMLDAIIGLEPVKRTIRSLERYALYAQHAAARGRPLPPTNLHMLFLGNPGTGKTMVARIVATMLYKIGIIRRNHCTEVTSKDLIAGYVGQTDKRTADVVRDALGGVLFIDEAYALASGGEDASADFGRESLAQLVKEMDDHRDDLVVIFAGYEREMRDFVDLNPGLASRIGYTFTFRDYSVDELLEMFRRKAATAGLGLGDGALEADLRELMAYFSRFKSFGNGRFVDEVFQKTIVHYAERTAADGGADGAPAPHLEASDLPSRRELFDAGTREAGTTEDRLDALVGLEELKGRIREFEKSVAFREEAARRGLRLPEVSYSMVLTGNPGTGKTTVARIIAAILYDQGAVPTDRFVEVEARDLSAFQFRAGRSPLQRYLDEAMGGVLFIDEAYALLATTGGEEVISALVKAMEDHRGELVVMFAGYREPMRDLLDANPGLASRVGYSFRFEDYSADELLEMFRRNVAAAGLALDEGAEAAARDALRYFHHVENFGNGRFVDRLLQEAIARHANRIGAGDWDGDAFTELTAEDIPSVATLCKLTAVPVFEPSDTSGEEARRRVACHEIGHALCRLVTTGTSDIVVITIEQEGNGALGYVQHEPRQSPLPTARDLQDEITQLMGGMAAEDLIFGGFSAGNASDLEEATRLALDYVARYGMSEAGFVQYLAPRRRGNPSQPWELPEPVLSAANTVLERCFGRAKELIEGHRAPYDALVAQLLDAGTLSGDDLRARWRALTTPDADDPAADEAGEPHPEGSDDHGQRPR